MGGSKRRYSESSEEPKEKRKSHSKKKKKKESSSSSSDSDSSGSYRKHKLKKKHKKKIREEKRKLKKLEKKLKRLERKSLEQADQAVGSGPSVTTSESGRSSKAMVPITKEEWEKKQSEVTRVFDPSSGRSRLVRGSGEIVEEIVSRDRQKQINKEATAADGLYFQKQTGML